MKKYAMISQPMRGKTDKEILAVKAHATVALRMMGYEVIDTFFDRPDQNDGHINRPLYSLAMSLGTMARCDAVYFCEGWEDTRGCKIEHDAAAAYGLELLYEG